MMKQPKPFHLNLLKSVRQKFSSSEGEHDIFLEESYYRTEAIDKFLENKYNYVVSAMGSGKSALYTLLLSQAVKFSKAGNYNFIGINSFFGKNDKQLLEESKNQNNTEDTSYTFFAFWSLYIAVELIKNIEKNYSNKSGFRELKETLSNFDAIRKEMHWSSLSSFVKNLKYNIKIKLSYLECGIESTDNNNFGKYIPIDLYEIYETINQVYDDHDIKTVLLIDKLDNFVWRKSYNLQKAYIAGLVELIENIHSSFKAIHIILFIRTDLFYNLDGSVQADKVYNRTIKLDWKNYETLGLIAYRILAVPKIRDDYKLMTSIGKSNTVINSDEIQRQPNSALNFSRFIRLFLPVAISEETLEAWILESFKDAKGFVNPRVIMLYISTLIDKQIFYNKHNNRDSISPQEIASIRITEDYYYFPLFKYGFLKEAYSEIQQNEIIKVFNLLSGTMLKQAFKSIVEYAKFNQRYILSLDDLDQIINNGKFDIDKSEKFQFINYLKKLGYWSETNNFLTIPTLFKNTLKIEGF